MQNLAITDRAFVARPALRLAGGVAPARAPVGHSVQSRSGVLTRATLEEAKPRATNGAAKGSKTGLDFDELTDLIKMVHSTDIVELELNSKKFKLTVKKREALEVGDTVKKGQTVCIIEAMKLMNEIEAEVSGTVVKIVAEHGKPVTPGSVLFIIKP
ncbi:Biotin carboxyl carrier protein of acetyl-CoA carboxylase, chloroplastic [Auxenochlorella protothecoides]|uniref:Biotin carboxyl carrier protein of acetyl-CoA carboxylase n=1 Tax=Auxenochlorella protothecoides TaxID=3075 RepID=A0A087SJU4_AUXPR|nr:Biotin carboxyl carrier protein of acetyl-CoA carboxylase, chloroplastic [Auxenochlorella protothecoides]KFM25998.1 Biotin carboxyl carrier protein of acetyl-CoA carboxylase, chloroplastic [Auxenochlorella protothecoides]